MVRLLCVRRMGQARRLLYQAGPRLLRVRLAHANDGLGLGEPARARRSAVRVGMAFKLEKASVVCYAGAERFGVEVTLAGEDSLVRAEHPIALSPLTRARICSRPWFRAGLKALPPWCRAA